MAVSKKDADRAYHQGQIDQSQSDHLLQVGGLVLRTVSAAQAKASYKPIAPRRLKGATQSLIQPESHHLFPNGS